MTVTLPTTIVLLVLTLITVAIYLIIAAAIVNWFTDWLHKKFMTRAERKIEELERIRNLEPEKESKWR